MGRSRWFVALLYFFTSFICGPITLNWTPFLELLLRNHAYHDLCKTDDPHSCPAQIERLTLLATLSTPAGYMVGYLVGVFRDRFGSRASLAAGVGCKLTAYVVLALARPTFDGYSLSFFLFACSDLPVVLGCVDVLRCFPGHEALAVGLLGVARSLSGYVPTAMRTLMDAGVPFTLAVLTFFFSAAVVGIAVLLAAPTADVRQVLFRESRSAARLACQGGLFRYLASPRFLFFLAFESLLVLVANLNTFGSPLSHLPHDTIEQFTPLVCIVVGLLGDYFGYLTVPFLLAVFHFCSSVSLATATTAGEWAGAILAMAGNSLSVVVVNLVIHFLAPHEMLGRVTGACFSLVGFSGLLHTPILQLAHKMPQAAVHAAAAGLSVLCGAFIVSFALSLEGPVPVALSSRRPPMAPITEVTEFSPKTTEV